MVVSFRVTGWWLSRCSSCARGGRGGCDVCLAVLFRSEREVLYSVPDCIAFCGP